MKLSAVVVHYQSFVQEQMILSMNTPGDDFIFIDRIISINHSQDDFRSIHRVICSSVIHTQVDDSINEYEIITMCISLLIIYT